MKLKLFTIASSLVLILSVIAQARNPNHKWDNAPFHIWFASQRIDDPVALRGYSCCGEADAHYAHVRLDPKAVGGWDVLVQGNWYPYPKPVHYHPNPTGRNVVWYNISEISGKPEFICLRIATGM